VDLSKDGTYNATVAGKLTIHGVTKDVSVPGTITVKGGTAMLKAKFVIKLADYKVKVPDMVADKVGKEATIVVDCSVAKK
jgi:polyisoprenoid-binding protein YceI